MNKKVISLLTSGLIMSTMIGCTSVGYQAEKRDMDLGVELMNQKMENDKDDLVRVLGETIVTMKRAEENGKIEGSKSPKQSDDMIYGMLKHSVDMMNNVENMSATDFLDKFNYEEAHIDDIEDFKKKVTPIFKDMVVVVNNIINTSEFNGVLDKENYDRFADLYDNEYLVYYKGYLNKVSDYSYGN